MYRNGRNGNKCSQWNFILSIPPNTDKITPLLKLPKNDILYSLFAICDDNTGNKYIEGYIKTTRRHRVSFVKKLIGEAIFKVVRYVPFTIGTLLLKPSFFKAGSLKTTRYLSFPNEVVSFKHNATLSMNQMKTSYHDLFAKIPELVITYLQSDDFLQNFACKKPYNEILEWTQSK